MKRRLDRLNRALAFAVLGVALPAMTTWAGDYHHKYRDHVHGKLIASGLSGTIGATIGPDGGLYVAEGALGQITRVDLGNGEKHVVASGLPPALIPIGGAMDIAFIGKTAYVLVTLVDDTLGGDQIDGIYRIDDKDSFTVVADIGAFAIANPPTTAFDLPKGVQYALQPVDDGLLVSDGHHNRVFHVAVDGDSSVITVLKQFENIVPTGLAATADRVYVAELGPVPHVPETGRIVSLDPLAPATERVVAAGVSMIVDVEFGQRGALYALSQGDAPPGIAPGDPAMPNTGRLLRVNGDGTFTVLADEINLPTSLDLVCGSAIVVTLAGEVWKFKVGRDNGCYGDYDYHHWH
jgi:hypothetical protein